ncbi:hypothetical protein [uncultured Methanobrevibacter sp.]|uniref:hypothetical protein n=1 Tax=uncultured Methanobrevibacter sp. TaxID=253161 RepID=UPI0025CEE098|nr:hypothetical protein [uncultured Methanobrevibacter sp.]
MCDEDYDEYNDYEDSYDDVNSTNEEESNQNPDEDEDEDDDFDNSHWHVGDPEDWADGPAGVPDTDYMEYIKKNKSLEEEND